MVRTPLFDLVLPSHDLFSQRRSVPPTRHETMTHKNGISYDGTNTTVTRQSALIAVSSIIPLTKTFSFDSDL